MRGLFRGSILLTALCLVPLFAARSATSPGCCTIYGRVTGPEGDVLHGATVMLLNTSLGAMTDARSEYVITGIPPGTYTVRAMMVGLVQIEVEGVSLHDGDILRLDLQLEGYSVVPRYRTPPSEMRDTVLTGEVVQTNWVDAWRDPENFQLCEGLDFRSHPGELRLQPLNRLIPAHFSILGLMEEDESSGTRRRSFEGDPYRECRDLRLDIDGNDVWEYVSLGVPRERILILRRFRAKRDFIMLFRRMPHLEQYEHVRYSDPYHPLLVTDDISNIRFISVDDLNMDGVPEIIVLSDGDEALSILEYDFPKPFGFGSRPSWIHRTIEDTVFGAQMMRIADLNGDGWNDIAAVGDSVGYWLNTGSESPGGWLPVFLSSEHGGFVRFALEDLDGDGDTDIMAEGRHGVSLFRNDGLYPPRWTEVHIARESRDGPLRACSLAYLAPDSQMVLRFDVPEGSPPWEIPYVGEGNLVSRKFRIDGGIVAARLECYCEYPDGLNSIYSMEVRFRVRTMANPSEDTEWSEELAAPCDILPYIRDNARWIQYEVLMRTRDTDHTPILTEVRLEYEYLESVPVR